MGVGVVHQRGNLKIRIETRGKKTRLFCVLRMTGVVLGSIGIRLVTAMKQPKEKLLRDSMEDRNNDRRCSRDESVKIIRFQDIRNGGERERDGGSIMSIMCSLWRNCWVKLVFIVKEATRHLRLLAS